MSQEAFDEFEQARTELLRKQRNCAWCDHKAETNDGLVRHILENHRDGPLKGDEIPLLKMLQERNAK